METSGEKERDRNSWSSIVCHHSMIDAAKLVVRDQLQMPINGEKSVRNTQNVFQCVLN
jgi:hypothetical protein